MVSGKAIQVSLVKIVVDIELSITQADLKFVKNAVGVSNFTNIFPMMNFMMTTEYMIKLLKELRLQKTNEVEVI